MLWHQGASLVGCGAKVDLIGKIKYALSAPVESVDSIGAVTTAGHDKNLVLSVEPHVRDAGALDKWSHGQSLFWIPNVPHAELTLSFAVEA